MRAFPFLKRGHPSEIEQRDQRQPTSGRHTGYSVTATCELFVPVSRVTSRRSLGIVSGVERDEANERPGAPARRPRFHFHYEAGAKRFAYAHSLSFARMFVRTRRDPRMHRVRAYLTPCERFIFLSRPRYRAIKIETDALRGKTRPARVSRTESFSRTCIWILSHI